MSTGKLGEAEAKLQEFPQDSEMQIRHDHLTVKGEADPV